MLLKFVDGMHATLATAADASWLFPFERVKFFLPSCDGVDGARWRVYDQQQP